MIFLQQNIRGILLGGTSGLTSSEFASVLATSGTTGAGGESSGNSWKNRSCCRGLQYTVGDAALPARDAEARKPEAVVAAVDNFQRPRLALKMQFPGLMRINKSTRMKMMTMLSGTLVTVMTSWMKQRARLVLPQMTQNFLNSLMAIWKTLMCPHLKCMHQQVAVFKKHVSFCLVLRVPEVTFLLLALALLTAWLSHPLIASLQSLVVSQEGQEEREIISAERWRVSKPSWYTWHLAKTTDLTFRVSSSDVQEASDRNWRNWWWTTSRSSSSSSSVHVVSTSQRSVHQNVPTQDKRLHFHLANGHWVPMLWVVQCSMLLCYGATVEETEQDQE